MWRGRPGRSQQQDTLISGSGFQNPAGTSSQQTQEMQRETAEVSKDSSAHVQSCGDLKLWGAQLPHSTRPMTMPQGERGLWAQSGECGLLGRSHRTGCKCPVASVTSHHGHRG